MSQHEDDTAQCLRKMPRKLKIGAYDWVVTLEEGEEGLCGQADFEFHKIRIWPSAMTSPSHVVGILLHECFHVIFDNQGLELLKKTKEAREEQIVIGFEAGMVSLLRDNAKFLTWVKRWLGKPI